MNNFCINFSIRINRINSYVVSEYFIVECVIWQVSSFSRSVNYSSFSDDMCDVFISSVSQSVISFFRVDRMYIVVVYSFVDVSNELVRDE